MAKKREIVPFTGKNPQPQTRRVPGVKGMGRQNRIAAQLLGIGYSIEEVAKDTGLEITHLKVLLKSHLFQAEMEKARDQFVKAHADLVREKIYAHAPDAVDTMVEIMQDPKHKDRLGAAREFVGRVVPLKQEGGQREPVVVININSEQMKGLESVVAEYEELPSDPTVPVEVEPEPEPVA